MRMPVPVPSPRDPLLRMARWVAGLASRWHQASLDGHEHLPEGPALLVGNHGLYGLDTPVFFHLLHAATGRLPVGLADRVVFGARPIRKILERLGGVPGTPEHAHELLGGGHLVVCYPGGAREVYKRPEARYRLRWETAMGFARVAIRAGVPIVPFAGHGVDDTYVNLGPIPALEARMGRYAVPVGVGLGPLPLPARFRFQLGRPLSPPANEEHAPRFKRDVQAAVEDLLAPAHQLPAPVQ
jgi:1-acyl-sn-glycerol-3-phosphate acyltransferase